MGLGFVLLFWGLTFLKVFGICGLILAGITYFYIPQAGKGQRRKASTIGFFFPVLLLPYLIFSFFIYAFWCEAVRGVDPGLGDSSKVPIGNGYSMKMTDLPNEAFIESPNEIKLSSVVELGDNNGVLFGRKSDHLPYFIFDLTNGNVFDFPSEEEFNEELLKFGVQDADLQSSLDYYLQERWGFQDFLALILILLPPFLAVWFLLKKLHKLKVARAN